MVKCPWERESGGPSVQYRWSLLLTLHARVWSVSCQLSMFRKQMCPTPTVSLYPRRSMYKECPKRMYFFHISKNNAFSFYDEVLTQIMMYMCKHEALSTSFVLECVINIYIWSDTGELSYLVPCTVGSYQTGRSWPKRKL